MTLTGKRLGDASASRYESSMV